MDETRIEIGGNSLLLWYGNLLEKISKYYSKRSETLINKGRKTVITNPTCKFVNPFTLIFTFTVDTNKKYQLITQGKYKDRYIEHSEKDTDDLPLPPNEMFIFIKGHQQDWFLKE